MRSTQKKSKTASAPPLESDFFEVAAGDRNASDRKRKLSELFKDKEFLPETMKVRDSLLELQNRDRKFFDRFFSTANYPAAFNPTRIGRLTSGTEDWQILKDLFDYARRFNVWISEPLTASLHGSIILRSSVTATFLPQSVAEPGPVSIQHFDRRITL